MLFQILKLSILSDLLHLFVYVGFCHIAQDKMGYPHNSFLISPQKHML